MDSRPEAADESAQWRNLVAQCDLLRAAAEIAWTNMIEAYKAAAAGSATIDPQLAVDQYRAAKVMQAAAERALLQFMEARRHEGH
jgi:hypothetical protein